MRIDKDTKLYISAASNPGSFGSTIYNELFRRYGINSVYISRKILSATNLCSAIRSLDIAGCSVSMPYKQQVINFIDEIDAVAQNTNSVNTIINKDGRLSGFNTDYYGVVNSIKSFNASSALVFGYGSVANSIVKALKDLSFKTISITGRDIDKAKAFQIDHDLQDQVSKFDILINATPGSIMLSKQLRTLATDANIIFDLVVQREETSLIEFAKNNSKETVSGIEMSGWQLQKQFELYTGLVIDISIIRNITKELYLK